MAVDFTGTWQMYEQDDPEEFLKAVSVPQLMAKMIREVKPLMIIKQTGDDFVVSVKTPLRTNTNSFTIGRESEFTTMDRVKTRATPQLVNGKIVIDTEKVTHMREIQGEQMIECPGESSGLSWTFWSA
ncbi:fatty acid-binding protein, liver isoform X2 [Silurus meridionalis]|uniref:fatty acid-binding protein, liver isoform X2 n=1 Tax=Silurus meridionalis TaxID=175797 RepID=UPI001EEAEFF7|nr:fatty acid-binding protein, liver isoform X2 [Silurus meridionalis]